jgi:hypothetical protein
VFAKYFAVDVPTDQPSPSASGLLDCTNVTDEEIIKASRFRHRVSNYLGTTGTVWLLVGVVIDMLHRNPSSFTMATIFEMIRTGITTAALTVFLAICRCPICDHLLSFYRLQCKSCGAKVR